LISTLISKARIKDIRALQMPKFRQIYNKFVAEGDKVCVEFLKSSKYEVENIYITFESQNKYQIPFQHSSKLEIISAKEMEQISGLKTPSDILMILDIKRDDIAILDEPTTAAIYLDGVQDPGNVGTIIRLADWFGIQAVIRSDDSADFFNPKVVQATMGSMANVGLLEASLSSLTHLNKDIVGTFMEGASVFETAIDMNAILVLGSEGRGIRSENVGYISHKISIPGDKNRLAESLNVSVAAGIITSIWKKGQASR
jgi:RNA methyltransferase, TrmH family